MADIRVNLCGIELKNPVIAASGTFGFGREYNEMYSISGLGGISCKGLTLEQRPGNPPPRIAETPSGILNSVGLQNPGVDHFLEYDLPWLRQQNTAVIVNIAGREEKDYCAMAERLSESDVDIIELNISCPNVKQGCAAFGATPDGAAAITSAVRKYCRKPLMVKLSPNVSSIADVARAVEAAGADALSLINTLLGMRIDIKTRRPILRNNTGGLSGPAVLPVAVRMVSDVYRAVKLPVVGMGGISDWRDAVEIMLAGACCVQVGTAIFKNPTAPLEIAEGIGAWLDEQGIPEVSQIVGGAMLW